MGTIRCSIIQSVLHKRKPNYGYCSLFRHSVGFFAKEKVGKKKAPTWVQWVTAFYYTTTQRVILSGAQRSRTRSAMRSIGIYFGISVSLFFSNVT